MGDQDPILLKETDLKPADGSKEPRDNLVQPFQVETLELRGRIVRLGSAVHDIISRHNYPYPIAKVLGEALTLAACLSNSMKFEGVFTLQAIGKGPLTMIVADVTDKGDVRGYASFDEEGMTTLYKEMSVDEDARIDIPIPKLMGDGYLSFTVDSNKVQDRYQGIVDLSGERLGDCIHHYFQQSAQIETVIKLAADHLPNQLATEKEWRSSALMLQRLPVDERETNIDEREKLEDDWKRAVVFLDSATEEEMLSHDLGVNGLLYRLFNEDGVRVFEETKITDKCRCDKSRMQNVVVSLTQSELEEYMTDGNLEVECQFCRKKRVYDQKKIDKLKAKRNQEQKD